MRAVAVWAALGLAVGGPLLLAAGSPLLAWRQPVYIAAGFAGVLGLGLLLVQPLLIAGVMPGLKGPRARRVHRLSGIALLTCVALHIIGLWITSPPDVIDVLTFSSPAPFALWGVLGMWALVFTALLVGMKRRLRLTPRTWRRAHTGLAVVIAAGTAAHALLIEGTMELWSKWALCLLVLAATLAVVWQALRR